MGTLGQTICNDDARSELQEEKARGPSATAGPSVRTLYWQRIYRYPHQNERSEWVSTRPMSMICSGCPENQGNTARSTFR